MMITHADVKRSNDNGLGNNEGEAKSVEQDQTAQMCSLILIRALRKIKYMIAKSG